MLQVYDRVLASGSVPTLVVISTLAATLYMFYGLLEGLRGRILLRLGQKLDASLSGDIFRTSTFLPLRGGEKGRSIRPVQDLDRVRQFLSGPGPSAIFDLPWMPIYLGIVFLFHSILGFVALGGAIIICLLIGLSEMLTRAPTRQAAGATARRTALVETSRHNVEAVKAMGIMPALTQRWSAENERYLNTQRGAADWSGLFSTSIKTIRFLLQSGILGIGAWLAIQQEISPGVMIAASILTSRALSPVEQAVGQWRGFLGARQSFARLKEVVPALEEKEVMELPLPARSLRVEGLFAGPVGSKTPYLQGINFDLKAGDGLGVIGPSGSGKSTLARSLVGLLPSFRGSVRLDDAELDQWNEGQVGRFIGYLPQEIQLFDGTVAENISRFEAEASSDDIIEAARTADLHDFIVSLPEGYNTVIGAGGYALSGGQKQRIALARAVYKKPFLVVLDEPNSNLDNTGEVSLANAIRSLRQQGCITVIIAHRPSALSSVDKVLCMKDGKQAAFGDKDEVMKQVLSPVPRREIA